MNALLSNTKTPNFTNFQIHANRVAMETKLCILIKDLNKSEGWFVYAQLLKHDQANILCFLLKLCKYECGWGKFRTSGMLKFDKF